MALITKPMITLIDLMSYRMKAKDKQVLVNGNDAEYVVSNNKLLIHNDDATFSILEEDEIKMMNPFEFIVTSIKHDITRVLEFK